MRLKLSSPPPIGSNLRSKALGETPLQPPPVNPGPVASAQYKKPFQKAHKRRPKQNAS